MPFWQFFRQGRDGRALLVRPSRIPHRISKNLFALGADEFLAMLEGKIRVIPFFKVQSGKITVCVVSSYEIKILTVVTNDCCWTEEDIETEDFSFLAIFCHSKTSSEYCSEFDCCICDFSIATFLVIPAVDFFCISICFSICANFSAFDSFRFFTSSS